MDSRAISAAFLVNFLLISAASAFNVTKLLSQFPDFTNFNDFLTQTKLADEINSRSTITILAVDNGAISSINGKPMDFVKRVLSVHVVLDYYDEKKLNQLSSNNATVLTTLYQASGAAKGQQGFLKVKLINEGEVAFASSATGGTFDSKLVKSVASLPYNISVLQISSPIQVPGIDSASTNSTPPAPPPKASSPAGSPKKAPAPSADSPSQADAPAAKKPKHKADAPVSSPPKADDGDGDADAASPGPSDSSGASKISFAGGAVVMAMISSILAL